MAAVCRCCSSSSTQWLQGRLALAVLLVVPFPVLEDQVSKLQLFSFLMSSAHITAQGCWPAHTCLLLSRLSRQRAAEEVQARTGLIWSCCRCRWPSSPSARDAGHGAPAWSAPGELTCLML